jgi:hypothetical protein
MAYFSNSTEGMIYQDQHCSKCVNWRDNPAHQGGGEGCPVWDLHILYNYDRDSFPFLEFLIPRSRDKLDNEQCSMFLEKEVTGDA